MKEICEIASLPQRTVSGIVNEMQKNGLLLETTGFSRNKVYMLKDYVDAFKIGE
jgi:sialic acid synthase SpsE